MESVYHIVAIRVNETSWAHVWRFRSPYLETGYDIGPWCTEHARPVHGDVDPVHEFIR
jgi:hypothetical protein